ncbi:MAG: hypothetical protein R3F20_05255 [Planctomycetota bacterium]
MTGTLRTLVAPEPLVLLDRADPAAVWDLAALRARRASGKRGRVAIDHRFQKVLPPMSRVVVRDDDADAPCVRVTSCDYAAGEELPLFALRTLLREERPGDRVFAPPAGLPRPDDALARIAASLEARYLWGGTSAAGSPALERELEALGLVPAAERAADPDLAILARVAGIDCSGLLDLATGFRFLGDCRHLLGAFPGALVPIPAGAEEGPDRIAAILRPLDVLLYRGHLVIVTEDGSVTQAVGEGANAETFARATGADPERKYDGVVRDDAAPILEALIRLQGRRFASDPRAYDDRHVLVVRPFGT